MIGDLGIRLSEALRPRIASATVRCSRRRLAGGQSVVERLADQRMPEAVSSRGAADLVDEFERRGLIEKIGHVVARVRSPLRAC